MGKDETKKITAYVFISDLNKLVRGDKIMIDKGSLGIEFGTFLNVKGYSIGGSWGEYKNDDGETKLYDETVWRLSKYA